MNNPDRRTYIGSTEVAGILGLDQYNSPYDIWERKTQDVPEKEMNDVMLFGKLLEPVIIGVIEQRENIKVVNNNKYYWDPEYPFMGTHPDGEHEYQGELCNNEVKTVASWAYKNWESDIPLEYYCQIQYTLDITKRKSCLFTVFEMDARKIHNRIVTYDPEFAAKQKGFIINFWNENVIKNIPPDYTVEDYKKMVDIYDNYREVEADVIHKIKTIRELEDKAEEMNVQVEKIKDEIKMLIGQNEGIRFGIDILATWKAQSKTTIDSKKLLDIAPSVYEECKKVSEFRVLRLKNKK
jgi:putative phage-type endonuclease